MWTKIKQQVNKWQEVLITASCITGLTVVASLTGLFQTVELKAFDQFTRLRPPEAKSSRIVIVTIDEQDLQNYGYPIPDRILAKAIKNLKQQQPRVIGLDLYRNLPQEPGHQELVEVFQSTDNLIGVEKVAGKTVPPPHTLPNEQVGLSDLIVDPDNRVRRALLSVQRNDGTVKLGLGALTALTYLAEENIYLETSADNQPHTYQLGKATIHAFFPNDGGYVRADAGGYQMLLNYRGVEYNFNSYPLSNVVEGNIPNDWAKDRIVFIGSISESVNDRFLTPFSSEASRFPRSTPGVVIHANIASQLLAAALDQRQFIRTVPNYQEWIWIFGWSLIGSTVSWQLIEQKCNQNTPRFGINWLIGSVIAPLVVLIGVSYLLLLEGWWIPVFAPLIATTLSASVIPNYKNYLMSQGAAVDSLTQIANRRHFDVFYPKLWNDSIRTDKPISVILCDVDYFKLYNDNYGHQAGDKCLYQVAQSLNHTIRSSDLVARYGGEEFIIILPNTDQETGFKVGERICQQIRALKIPHQHSFASDIVTISLGLATAYPHNNLTPEMLVKQADDNLYLAKAKGRNNIFTDKQDQTIEDQNQRTITKKNNVNPF
jgi:diguanylate cyclase (GGDEF)-like protein